MGGTVDKGIAVKRAINICSVHVAGWSCETAFCRTLAMFTDPFCQEKMCILQVRPRCLLVFCAKISETNG